MRKVLMLAVAAAAISFAGSAAAAPWAGAAGMKAVLESHAPVAPVGCRSNGRKCPIGSQEECRDGRCTCKPCPY